MPNFTKITIEAHINASPEMVWKIWTSPEHITQWNSASPDWHTPKAEHNLTVGGTFTYRMEAKDGSFGFDFGGTFTKIEQAKEMAYVLGDERSVSILFHEENGGTHLVQTFDAENQNPLEMQQAGWQAILNNFKTYTESL